MAGGSGGTWWKLALPGGVVAIAFGMGLEYSGAHLPILVNALLAIGGLITIAASCTLMINAAVGLAGRLRWNEYVAGVIAGLASNIPEVAMLGFLVAEDVRVAFVVALLTLHINALVFSIFCILLPRDEHGRAGLPKAIGILGSDMLACAAGFLLAMGFLMIAMSSFGTGMHAGQGLGAFDLVVIAAILLAIMAVYVNNLVGRFSGSSSETGATQAECERSPPPSSWAAIVGFGALGALGSLAGGHAVGDFAGTLVDSLRGAGYSEMIGAIVVSFLAGTASYILVTTAHVRGRTELALSNVFGALVQVPFVILPAVLLFAAGLAALGFVPTLAHGGILAIDLETVSVTLFTFPTLLVLWKAITDDGSVNRLETAIMVGLFGLVLYFLAIHG